MSEYKFDLAGVRADAMRKTGLDDFGPEDYLPGLEKLLETYDTAGYDEKGRKRQRRRVVDLLSARLRIENGFKRFPEIKQEQIKAPMYLTGLPRTGTSALLNLLSNDEVVRPLPLWEGLNPDPMEDFEHGKDDPRYLAMKAFYDDLQAKDPNFKKIHSTSADTPEECIHLLNHTFSDVQFGIETMMEPYGSWFQQQDLTQSYAYYADILRMLQWQRPGSAGSDSRWLLKSPCHLWALDQLVALFPDCSIIITHRNPLQCVTSYASMMAAMMNNRECDKKALGPVVMEYLAAKLERSLEQRQAIDDKRILDLQFNDFIDDGLATVDKIYQHFDLPMTDKTRQAMQAYADEHPMGKHGKHDYQLDEYGLSEQQILDRFGFYIERFAIPMD